MVGTHALYALSVIRQVDQESPILSPTWRDLVTSYLANTSRHLEGALQADGAIDPLWHTSLSQQQWYQDIRKKCDVGKDTARQQKFQKEWQDILTGDRDAKVHITGHHLEWLFLLPPELQPPSDFLPLVPASCCVR